jgi:hypothetical protein
MARGPCTGGLADQVVAFGDVRGPTGCLGVGGGSGRQVAGKLVQVAPDGVHRCPVAEHLAQPSVSSSLAEGPTTWSTATARGHFHV